MKFARGATVEGSGFSGRGGGHPAGFVCIVGIAFLILFFVALMMQVQTNEAFITHQGVVNVFHPNIEILVQIPNLVIGNPSQQEAMATMFGWGIELIYLGFIIGYEVLQTAASRSGQLMAGIFRTFSWAGILFNFWTDANYGTIGSGLFGHIGFGLMVSFIVGFFGTVGMFLIGYGWRRV
jgi:hypothetical protein